MDNRTYLCIKNFHELFKCEPFPKEGSDPQMMEILQKYIFGEIFATGDLTLRERELITVTALAVMQTLPQLKAHLNAALNAGASPVELREAMYQLSAFIGFPKTLNALDVLSEVLSSRGIALPLPAESLLSEQERQSRGRILEGELFTYDFIQSLEELPCATSGEVRGFIRAFGLGDLFTREGLELTDRTLLAVVALTALASGEGMDLWLNAAFYAGNTADRLAAALIQVMPYTGFPAAVKALKDLGRVIESLTES